MGARRGARLLTRVATTTAAAGRARPPSACSNGAAWEQPLALDLQVQIARKLYFRFFTPGIGFGRGAAAGSSSGAGAHAAGGAAAAAAARAGANAAAAWRSSSAGSGGGGSGGAAAAAAIFGGATLRGLGLGLGQAAAATTSGSAAAAAASRAAAQLGARASSTSSPSAAAAAAAAAAGRRAFSSLGGGAGGGGPFTPTRLYAKRGSLAPEDVAFWAIVAANAGVLLACKQEGSAARAFALEHMRASLEALLDGRLYTVAAAAVTHLSAVHCALNLLPLALFRRVAPLAARELVALFAAGALAGAVGHLAYFWWDAGGPEYGARYALNTPAFVGCSGGTAAVLARKFASAPLAMKMVLIMPVPVSFALLAYCLMWTQERVSEQDWVAAERSGGWRGGGVARGRRADDSDARRPHRSLWRNHKHIATCRKPVHSGTPLASSSSRCRSPTTTTCLPLFPHRRHQRRSTATAPRPRLPARRSACWRR